MKIKNIALIVTILFPFVSVAQYKFEREYRIKSVMIPQSASVFIDSINPDLKSNGTRKKALRVYPLRPNSDI